MSGYIERKKKGDVKDSQVAYRPLLGHRCLGKGSPRSAPARTLPLYPSWQ